MRNEYKIIYVDHDIEKSMFFWCRAYTTSEAMGKLKEICTNYTLKDVVTMGTVGFTWKIVGKKQNELLCGYTPGELAEKIEREEIDFKDIVLIV